MIIRYRERSPRHKTTPQKSEFHNIGYQPSYQVIIGLITTQEKSDSKKLDSRLFIRLELEHERCKLSYAVIRELSVNRLHVSLASINLIKPARSGFALSPCSIEAREETPKAFGFLLLSGT